MNNKIFNQFNRLLIYLTGYFISIRRQPTAYTCGCGAYILDIESNQHDQICTGDEVS